MKHSERRPDFFIVGAPKAGTTALFEHLGRHPEVFVPRIKEPMFFGSDFDYLNCSPPARQEYLSLFANAGNARRVGEGSTTYLYSKVAADEIRAFNPDARIIIMLRDPVTVMYAWYSEAVVTGVEPIRDFSKALQAEPRRQIGEDLPNRRVLRQSLYYRHIVDFTAHVDRYFETFGRSHVQIVLFDDWVADTARVWRETLEFLGIDPTFRPGFGVVNPSRLVRLHGLHDLISEPPAVIKTATRVLPFRARHALRHRVLKANSRVARRPPMDPNLESSLRAEYAPRIAQLAGLIDRDLSTWVTTSS